MAKRKRIHKRKKIGGKKQAAEEPGPKIELEETKTKSAEAAAKEYPSTKGHGTRYNCLYSMVRKKAGTTFSPKYSPKH